MSPKEGDFMNNRVEEFIQLENTNEEQRYSDSYYHDDYHDEYGDEYRDEYVDDRYDDVPGGADY